MDDLVRTAHPFVSEDGTWIRHHVDQTVVEEVGIDDVLAAEVLHQARTERPRAHPHREPAPDPRQPEPHPHLDKYQRAP